MTLTLRARRVLHAGLVATVALSALALVDALGLASWHRPAGYAALAVVALRLAAGRFPLRLTAALALARIAVVAALAFTGWLYTTDAYWGSETVESIHRLLAWTLLALVIEHVIRAIALRARAHETTRERVRRRTTQ